MQEAFRKYQLGGSLDTTGSYAGKGAKNITGVEIRVYQNGSLGSITGGEADSSMSYMVNGHWSSFVNSAMSDSMDGIKIQTSPDKSYYLSYKTKNEGKSDYYPAVKSTVDDYAGSPGKPIQRLNIRVYDNAGTSLTSGVIVMYRAFVEGRWLPWVSNADPDWMRFAQNKYSLDGTLDEGGSYAGIDGKNISGIEIHIFEETAMNPGASFTGSERPLSLSYMFDSSSNWSPFDKVVTSNHIDGLKIQTGSSESFYLVYKTWNEGKDGYYPEVSSTEDDYAGSPGKPIQRLSIHAYRNDGTKLTTGVVIMYRALVEGRWLPWVSNADPDWMRSVQSQYNLGGTLDESSGYAGISGKNISGIEIRAFEGNTASSSIDGLTGTEAPPTLSYMYDSSSNWMSFSKSVMASHIDGIKIQTSADKPYYLAYKTWNEGKGDYYPVVRSTEDDYAGSPGRPIQLLNIRAYRNDGVNLAEGVVVMYRVYTDGRWLPWVSNANPNWMESVQLKYNLGGRLDTGGTYAGLKGKNISGVEIRVFEEKDTTVTPTGKYKIIDAPYINQKELWPTGCESVTAVMALNYIGNNIDVDTFIDNYLDKQPYPFDPNETFGGSPKLTSGYGCYAPVIQKALNRILLNTDYSSKVLTNVSLKELCSKYIDNNIPVIMWATMGMQTSKTKTWTYNGKTIKWVQPEHCLLLVGYDDNNYIFNDPLQHKQTYYSKSSVTIAYAALGQQAIVITRNVNAKPRIDELERIDRTNLINTYYYSQYDKNRNTVLGHGNISSSLNDYTILSCLQTLYAYFYDKQDYEKTDMLYDEMIRLRKLLPSYRTIYASFLDSNGEFDLGYQYYAKGRKTAKLQFEVANCFTKDDIRQMHQADSIMSFLAKFIPVVGTPLSILMSSMQIIEQNGLVGLSNEIVSDIESYLDPSKALLDILITLLNLSDGAKYALNTFEDFISTSYDIAGENRETYVKDGVTLQDGDAYIRIWIYFDMGTEYHQFQFYFRNGYPYVTNLESYNYRLDDRMPSGLRRRMEEFENEGYVPSEIHLPRSMNWPYGD